MRKDLEKYLMELQKQYTEMRKAAEEANELLLDGKIPMETAEQIQKCMTTIDNNYQRVLYCRYLVNLPPKFIQKIRQKQLERDMKKFKEEHADEYSVVNETQENLDEMKSMIPQEEENETDRNENVESTDSLN